MVVRYSGLESFEVPKFTLCNPGSVYNGGALSGVVGILTDHEAEEIVFNFNSTSELNFRVNKITRDGADDNAHTYSLYKALQSKRLIFVDDIGFFIISSVVNGYENGIHYKDITAKSIDAEIEKMMVPYIVDGTYRFLTEEVSEAATEVSENAKGILNTIIETIPLWEIGYVDETVANKWRTFEDVDTSTNCLSFLLENVQDAYECIIIFDIINRKVNVYSQDDYVHQTNIHLTKDDLINSINITENSDDLYTAISVFGDEDNISISAINPLGGNTIYNFGYYMDWMSEGLRSKVSAWQEAVSNAENEYYQLNDEYYQKYSEAQTLNYEIESLNTQITMYTRCRENIIAESSTQLVDGYNSAVSAVGGELIEIKDEIEETIAMIDELISECEAKVEAAAVKLDSTNSDMSNKQSEINQICNALSIKNYFSSDEYSELSHYIFEGSYRDEYITVTDTMSYTDKLKQMKTLYDRSKTQLGKISEPTQEFSVDVENFIFSNKFQKWSEQLETGCLINVELDTDDVALLFLSNMTINYDDHSLSMTFGNRFNKFDPKSLFENVLGNVSKSANSLNYIKDILYPIKNGELNVMKEALETSRNLSMSAVLSSTDEEVVIDSSGYTGKRLGENGEYEPEQIKITGSRIVFTDDGWDSSKTAIGKIIYTDESGDTKTVYGINAEAIIGDLLIGNNIRIIDSDGNDIFSVIDGKIETYVTGVIEGDENGKQPDGESDSIITQFSSLKQTADSIKMVVGQITEEVEAPDENGENGKYSAKVDHVKTATGYTFDEDGLNISASGEEIENLLNHKGMYVRRVTGETEDGEEISEDILTADANGVNAIDLTARQYLIIGSNSRFEDYDNGTDGNRTACFYIGA